MKPTPQLATPTAPEGSNAHDDALNRPSPEAEKLTTPVGVDGLAEVSVTVAVHEVAWSGATAPGEHDKLIDVEARLGESKNGLP